MDKVHNPNDCECCTPSADPFRNPVFMLWHARISGLLPSELISQSYITTDSLSASPSWCQAPIWDPRSIFPILSFIIFFFLTVSGLLMWTKSRVCTFQFLPGIVSSSFPRSESHGTHEHSFLSLFLRLPQPGEPGSCIYFPQEQGSPIIPSGIGLSELISNSGPYEELVGPLGWVTSLSQGLYLYLYRIRQRQNKRG
jgi:hypothetical protein